MPRITSCDGDIDDLGVLITRAYGLDRSWAADGRCSTWRSDDLIPSPWQFDPKQVVRLERPDGTIDELRGAEMQKMALMTCHACPAQYDCAAYALEAGMLAGTWAMKAVDLAWLRKLDRPAALRIIGRARRTKVAVQVIVRRERGVDAKKPAA